MQKIILFLLTIVLSAAISCTKEDDFPEPSEQPGNSDGQDNENVIAKDFVPIDWEQTELLQLNTDENIVTLSKNTQTENLKQGQIITVANDTVSYVFIVNDIVINNNEVTLHTERGDLCDIFANTRLNLSSEASPRSRQDGSSSDVYTPVKITFVDEDGSIVSVSRAPDNETTRVTGKLWKWENDREDIVFYDNDGAKVFLHNPTCAVNLDVSMELNFGSRTKPQLLANGYKRYKSSALEIKTSLIGSIDNGAQLKALVNGNARYKEDDDEIFKHNVFKPCNLTFNVAGAVIVITLSADMFRGAMIEASGELEAFAGYEQKIIGTASTEWHQSDGKLTPSTSFEYIDHKIPPTLKGSGSLNAKAWFFPRIYLSLYGAIGPSFDIKPYIGSEISAGFRLSPDSASNFLTWQLRNYLGLELAGGLSLKFMNYEIDHKETCKCKVFEKDIYTSPAAIELVGSGQQSISEGESNYVEFYVFDRDLFGNKVNTVLPIVAKFEAEGSVSPTYCTAENGLVGTNWIPQSSNDILSATLYDKDGNIIDQARINTNLEDAGSLTQTEYYDDNAIKSFTISNNMPAKAYNSAIAGADEPYLIVPYKLTCKAPEVDLSQIYNPTIEINLGENNRLIEIIDLSDHIVTDKNNNMYWDNPLISITDTLVISHSKLTMENIELSYPSVQFNLYAQLKYWLDNNEYSDAPVKQSYTYSRPVKVSISNLHVSDGICTWDTKIDGTFWMWKTFGTDESDYHFFGFQGLKEVTDAWEQFASDLSDYTFHTNKLAIEDGTILYYKYYFMGELKQSSQAIRFTSDSDHKIIDATIIPNTP